MSEQQFLGKYPAVVRVYDAATRLARVEIPQITDGGDVLPEAQICYPLGDKSRTKVGTVPTEIELLPDDLIWVEFINGDQNHPVIVGYRCPKAGNDVGWRRFHHQNIQLVADAEMAFNAVNLTVTLSGDLTINATGNVAINSATLKHNGVSVGSAHKHSGVQTGGGNTGNPI